MRPFIARVLVSCLAVLLCPLALAAQTGSNEMAYPVFNHGRLAGYMTVVRNEGSAVVRVEYRDRNRGQWFEMRYELSESGLPASIETYPIDNKTGETGDRSAWFRAAADSVRWNDGDETQAEPAAPGLFYLTSEARPPTPFHLAWLAHFLLDRPDQAGRTVPDGTDRTAAVVAEAIVTADRGPERVRLVTFGGPDSNRPPAVWIDDEGDLFATRAGWFITVRPGAAHTLPTLRSIEAAYLEREAARLAAELMPELDGPLVVANGNVFDVESGALLPNTTVVIEDDRIVAVGPSETIEAPDDATVIDASGRTVIPGLWDMHVHVGHGAELGSSLQKLAAGITSVRDLAADVDAAVSQRDRADAGEIVSPRLVLAGFIEGPGAWAGPTAAIAGTVEEALEWIELYDSLGYVQIKLYNIIHPDLVPAIGEETERRGMLLSGHIPRGMSIEAAVGLGYDEIQHAAFLFSNHFQDSLYVPEMRPYSGVANLVAPNFDVDGDEMTELIEFLVENQTMMDGTWALWIGGQILTGESRPHSEAYLRALTRLYEEGVPLVPGTDSGAGFSLLTELAVYEHAGIPAEEVLRIATINSARFLGQDDDYGSIAVGKVADLAIIDGDPTERIVDLWFVDQVIRAGKPYDAADLRRESGWQAPDWWTGHIREVTGRDP